MKQLIRRPGLSIIFLAGILATISAAEPKAQDAEPDFKTLHAKVDSAWESLKAENASPYYAHDAGLVFYDAAPVKYDGWAAYRDGAQKLFLDTATSLKFNVNDDLKVTRRGKVAWTTRTMHLKANMKEGKPIEFEGRDTVIWENRGGKWLIVHEHLSAPLPE
jgi:ketosteroid isomerase-like protein